MCYAVLMVAPPFVDPSSVKAFIIGALRISVNFSYDHYYLSLIHNLYEGNLEESSFLLSTWLDLTTLT